MKEYKIEKNIPIPSLKGKPKTEESLSIEEILDDIDVDSSFLITTSKEYYVYNWLLKSKYNKTDKKFKSRRIESTDHHRRIWRIE